MKREINDATCSAKYKENQPSIANCGCFTILFPFFVHRSLLIVKGKLKEKKDAEK